MMMNRDRLGFWTKVFAIGLAAVFLLSFIFMGVGTNINYNLFDLFGGNKNAKQGGQTVSAQEQIRQAEKQVEKNPKDPQAVQTLAALYYQNNRPDDATKVLEKGRKDMPKNADIANTLGSVYAQQAQAASDKEKEKLFAKAGDSFADATKLEPKSADSYYFAGQAYDQAGDSAKAIEYYNGYLDRAPKGDQAKAVKDRISQILKGENTTGASGGG
ncbi:MAG TPA: tetratricopeptide repeat protein [Rubrobacteraceae bacterium]|nr:tetratricopeptide repeat protein [Rubrobacteraceae bacterium]